jgi:hypothetical protein
MISLVIAALTLSTGPQDVPKAQPKLVCGEVSETGSRIPKRVCMTREQLEARARLADAPTPIGRTANVLINRIS